MWVFPSLYIRTDPYGPYGTRRIHLRVLASMGPKYTRMPIDSPYLSDRKRVILYGHPTDYRSIRLSKSHKETDSLRHIYIAPCAEDSCMNYIKNYISVRLSSHPSSKLRGKSCPVIGLLSNMTASRGKCWLSGPFHIYTYSHFSCPVSFLFKFLQYLLQICEYQKMFLWSLEKTKHWVK